jgi:hypothetical protein
MIALKVVTPNGEEVDVIPDRVNPLSYNDLVSDHKNPDKLHPITLEASSVKLPDSKGESRQPADVSITMNFGQPASVFALVEGGWLPPPFVNPPQFLVDRNVVISLSQIRRGLSNEKIESREWWFQLFENFSATINPVLYAFEGDNRQSPSFDDFRRSFDAASQEVSRQLPGSKLITYDEIHYAAAYDAVLRFADRYEREVQFLMTVAPMILSRSPQFKVRSIQEAILKQAQDLKLHARSLSVVAVLSCLYENKDGSGFGAARRVLKPSSKYTRADAHNAICDLRALEIFISGLGIERPGFSLCTCDLPLAAFWSGMNASGQRWEGSDRLTFTMSLTSDLFPRLQDDEREELAAQLRQ